MVVLHSPVFGFHIRREQSSSPPTEAMVLPSEEKQPAVTGPEWPANICREGAQRVWCVGGQGGKGEEEA